jgi:hypothetical protein
LPSPRAEKGKADGIDASRIVGAYFDSCQTHRLYSPHSVSGCFIVYLGLRLQCGVLMPVHFRHFHSFTTHNLAACRFFFGNIFFGIYL